MGRINKYANIYKNDGTLLRKKPENEPLKKLTISELEEIAKNILETAKIDDKPIDYKEFYRIADILWREYQKNPEELENAINESRAFFINNRNIARVRKKTQKEEINNALNEIEITT